MKNGEGYYYDDLDRVVRVVDAEGGITSFTYDANGNLLSVTDAKVQLWGVRS